MAFYSFTTSSNASEQVITEEPDSYDASTSPATPAHSNTFKFSTTDSGPSHDPPRRRLSAHAQADAARAIQRTNSWKPVIDRRQSWSIQDMKHEMHMLSITTVTPGPGFTEKDHRGTQSVRT
ncbi:hypothetical protein EDB81DRAFT_763687 [Dactylonectria macrodidyma]|uniref:Uncharacterized protein n=1 Tax=Dactylonectria macrodidyma TaxID=307937 RepID=A0A9P9ISQ1_9HYPO|nr:hypothetical protein EDB81DRAFT_763687 [Dactylonectria macrodidyma]